jgi:hypothetical protein
VVGSSLRPGLRVSVPLQGRRYRHETFFPFWRFSSSTRFTTPHLRCKASECVDTVNRKITDHGRGDAVLTPSHRGITVSKLFALEPLGLASSEKQIPQIVEPIRSEEN